MQPADETRFVPKVHPLAREAGPEDPLELMAEPAPGDPAVMLECLLQEFTWMGFTADELLALFHNPGYPLLCELREFFGEEAVRRHVETLASRWGAVRFRETIAEEEKCDAHEPELVQIQLSPSGREG
jgi:hypothetical protein